MNFPQKYKRDALFAHLADYDSFAKPDDFVEITHWHNGEGFDIHLSTCSGEKQLSITWGEFEAIKALVPG